MLSRTQREQGAARLRSYLGLANIRCGYLSADALHAALQRDVLTGRSVSDGGHRTPVAAAPVGRRFALQARTASDEAIYVLCEINIYAVSPFPEKALEPLAQATQERLRPVPPVKGG